MLEAKQAMGLHFLKAGKPSYLKVYLSQFILCFLFVLAIHPTTLARDKFSLRKFINPLHVNISVGYGMNFYENTVANFNVFEKEGKHYLAAPGIDHTVYLVRWFGNSYIRTKNYSDLGKVLKNPGVAHKIIFTGVGSTLPITISGHIDFLKKIRLELGGSLLINKIKTLKPDQNHAYLGKYQDPFGTHYVIRPFLLFGVKLLENETYTMLLNSQVSFDFTYTSLTDTLATHRSAFPPLGLGLTIEKHISEYCSAFGKVMYDTKKFMEEMVKDHGVILKQQGFYVQFGVSLKYPELSICPIEHCEVEVKHKHSDKPYRGVSIWQGKTARGDRLYAK